MFTQYLPTYTHAFLSYSNWITAESEHYIFHYTQGSEAEKDIERITHTQEEAFKKVIDFLHVEPPTKKISYYFIQMNN